jgi:hypothetical protein
MRARSNDECQVQNVIQLLWSSASLSGFVLKIVREGETVPFLATAIVGIHIVDRVFALLLVFSFREYTERIS